MRAKFLRKEKSKYWGYDYYFECIDCGEEYTRERYDDRTSPYCGACWRKHSLERKKIREKQKKQAEINEVLDKIREEIDILIDRKTMYIEMSVFQRGLSVGLERAIMIIDKYREGSEGE